MMKRRPRRRTAKKQTLTIQQVTDNFEQLYDECHDLWTEELLNMEQMSWPQLTAVHLQLCKLEELARLTGVEL